MNNINNINNTTIKSTHIKNYSKTFNQSKYFIVDKYNSNSSPTVITINKIYQIVIEKEKYLIKYYLIIKI